MGFLGSFSKMLQQQMPATAGGIAGAGVGSSAPKTTTLSTNYTASNGQTITPDGRALSPTGFAMNVPSIDALQERNRAIFGNPNPWTHQEYESKSRDVARSNLEEQFKNNPTNTALYEAQKRKIEEPLQSTRDSLGPGAFSQAKDLAEKYPGNFRTWTQNDWNYLRSQDPMGQTDSEGNVTTITGQSGAGLASGTNVEGGFGRTGSFAVSEALGQQQDLTPSISEKNKRNEDLLQEARWKLPTRNSGGNAQNSVTNTGITGQRQNVSPPATTTVVDNGYTPQAPDGGWENDDRVLGYDAQGNKRYAPAPPRMQIPEEATWEHGGFGSVTGNPLPDPNKINYRRTAQDGEPDAQMQAGLYTIKPAEMGKTVLPDPTYSEQMQELRGKGPGMGVEGYLERMGAPGPQPKNFQYAAPPVQSPVKQDDWFGKLFSLFGRR